MDGRRFEVILKHQTVAFSLCTHLPVPFLRLRGASRSTLMPINIQMGHRIVLLKKHRLLMESGIVMLRLLHCVLVPIVCMQSHIVRQKKMSSRI